MMYQNQNYNPYMNNQSFLYQQQMKNMEQYYPNYQQMNNNFLHGKVVNTQENINANDVPMDGNTAFFPKSDMSEIYAKFWNAKDGSINTIVFKPFIDKEVVNSTDNETKSKFDISEESRESIFNHIDERIDKLEKLLSARRASRTKKDGDEE